MIKYENGKLRYFDKNGKEITNGCVIRYDNGKEMMVYETTEEELGTDATNPVWIEKGWAVPCEYGIYLLTREDTESCEVVAYGG